jgi:hypothetical protein
VFQQAPEILDAIHVNMAFSVFFGIVYHILNVLRLNAFASGPGIGEHLPAGFNVLADFAVERDALSVLQHHSADAAHAIFAMTLKQSHRRYFARVASLLDCGLATIFMHEPREVPNKTFVGLKFTLHLIE